VLVAVLVGVSVGVLVAVLVGVSVGVLVAVLVGVSVGVFVAVLVGVLVAVLVGVLVGVIVAVRVGVGVRQTPSTHIAPALQQESPQEICWAAQVQRRRLRASGSPQSPEQHWASDVQETPPSRQPAASPERAQRTVLTGPPMPIAAMAALPIPFKNERRDGRSASCFAS
jgi:hypothetical protein